MAQCININHPEYSKLLTQSGLSSMQLSAKMGVWMEKNNSDEWPTLEQLGITPILAAKSSIDSTTRDVFNHYPNKVYSEQQVINLAKRVKEYNKNNESKYKFEKTPFGSNSYKVNLINYIESKQEKTFTRLDFYQGDEVLMEQEEGIQEQRRQESKLGPEEREDFENKKAIMLKVFPFVEQVIEDYSIPQTGLVEAGGIIRVNPLYWTKDTLGHEFGHILLDSIGGITNPLVAKGVKLLTNSDIWIKTKELYPDIYEKDFVKFQLEVLSQAIGEETVVLYDQSKQPSFLRWLNQIIKRIMQALHIGTPKEVTDLARMIISDSPVAQGGEIGSHEQRRKYSEVIKEEVEGLTEEVDKIESIRKKALTILGTKSKLYSVKYRLENTKAIDLAIKQIEQLDKDPIAAVQRYINFVTYQTDVIYADYLKTKDSKGFGNIKLKMKHLSRWNNYVSGFNNIEELSALAESIMRFIYDPKTKEDVSLKNINNIQKELGLKEFDEKELERIKKLFTSNIETLHQVTDRKNEITNYYLKEGKKIVIDFLTPHSKVMIANAKEQFERDYISLSDDEKKLISKKAYIDQQLQLNADDIKRLTEKTISDEIEKAGRDITYAERWIDNALDSPDVVVSAMVSAFQDAMFEARLEKMELRKNILTKLQKLEKSVESMGLTGDLMKAYDFMLERDSQGNLTGNTIDKFRSTMWVARESFREQLRNADWTNLEFLWKLRNDGYLYKGKYTDDVSDIRSGKMTIDQAVDKCMRSWTSMNAPISEKNRELLEDAKQKFFKESIATGIMTQADVDLIEASKDELIKHEKDLYSIIPYEAAASYELWIRQNIWKYREPIEAWANPQYDKLMSLPDTDPRKEFYNFIMDNLEYVQSYIPSSYRLNQRLPGILKSATERINSDTNVGKDVAKNWLRDNFNIRADETERGGEEIVDELGNRLLFVPIYYTNDLHNQYKVDFEKKSETEQKEIVDKHRIDYAKEPIALKNNMTVKQYAVYKESNKDAIKNQSFDLAGGYYKYFSSAIDFIHKSEILSEMEMAKFFVEQREVTKTTASGTPIIGKKSKEVQVKKPGTSHIAAQLRDWFEAMMYGLKETDTAKMFGGKVDVGKAANLLGRFTSLNLLGLNFVQGTANVLLGEASQLIEAIGGEYFNIKDLTKARAYYFNNVMGLVKDIGTRQNSHIVNLLNDEFDILNEYDDGVFRENSRFRKLLNTNTLYFTSHMGEHYMQTAVMLAMLSKIEAKVGDEVVGNMMEVAQVKNGRLVFETKDGKKITNFNTQERSDFSKTVKRVLSSIHGEYSDAGRVAWQREATGRLAVMFRKFIVPGIRRRYGRKRLNNLLGENVEGYYITSYRFIRNLMNDLKILKWNLATEDLQWKSMTEKEKANLKKALSEVSFMIMSLIMASVCMAASKEGNSDDDDLLLDFLTYQSLRFRAEMWFFSNLSESLKIMRSPTAAMSVLENTIKLTGQLLDPFEKYERGNWKGQYKMSKILINYIPAVKQIYRLKYIDDQSSWLKN